MPNVRVANLFCSGPRARNLRSLLSQIVCDFNQRVCDWWLTLASAKCDIFVSEIKQNEQTPHLFVWARNKSRIKASLILGKLSGQDENC